MPVRAGKGDSQSKKEKTLCFLKKPDLADLLISPKKKDLLHGIRELQKQFSPFFGNANPFAKQTPTFKNADALRGMPKGRRASPNKRKSKKK